MGFVFFLKSQSLLPSVFVLRKKVTFKLKGHHCPRETPGPLPLGWVLGTSIRKPQVPAAQTPSRLQAAGTDHVPGCRAAGFSRQDLLRTQHNAVTHCLRPLSQELWGKGNRVGRAGGQPGGAGAEDRAMCDGIVSVPHSMGLGTLRTAQPRNGQEPSMGPSRRLLGNPGAAVRAGRLDRVEAQTPRQEAE